MWVLFSWPVSITRIWSGSVNLRAKDGSFWIHFALLWWNFCFCNRSDTFLQLLPLCSCGPSGSTWAHMTRGRSVLFFCPRSGTSPVQWWATYLWKVCEEKGQNCQPVSSCTQYMGNGLHPSWSTRILDKKKLNWWGIMSKIGTLSSTIPWYKYLKK